MIMEKQALKTESAFVIKESPGLKVETKVYKSFDELTSFQQEWDSFVESVGSEIYLTFDWCRIWWKYYGEGRDLKIFIFFVNGDLAGIIPMFFEKIWLGPFSVRVLKIVGTDFTPVTIILPICKEFLLEVVREFVEKATLDCRWDVLHIGPVSGIQDDFGELVEVFRKSAKKKYQVKNSISNVQTYFKVADSWQEQAASFKKKERQLMKKSYGRIDKKEMSLVSRFINTHDFEEKFADFVELHQKRWQGMGESGHFGDWPDSRQFHHDVALAELKHDRLRLLEVEIGGICAGYQYGYKFGERYYSFLDARRDEQKLIQMGLGRIVFAEQTKKAISEKVKSIDSMQGKYDFKIRLGGRLLPINNLYMYSSGPICFLKIWLFRQVYRVLNICYYKIWFCRVARKLGVKRGALWNIWIKGQMLA